MVNQMLQNSTTCTFIFNNLYLCSIRYSYIQHFTFIFNNTPICFRLQPKLFSFSKNICSTPTKNKNNVKCELYVPYMVNQMLQNSTTCTFIFNNLYLCSIRCNYIQHFTFIFNNIRICFRLQPKLFSFNKNICSTSTKIIFL